MNSSRYVGRFITVVLIATVCLGCRSESTKSENNSSAIEQAVPEQSVAVSADEDPKPVVDAVEAVAKIRRDGNGQIIEVDLRKATNVEVISSLYRLPKLRSVLLADSGVSDDDLVGIGKITTLENLDLRGCSISDTGVDSLGGLSRLKSIKFSGKSGATKISDASLETLGKLSNLKVIALDFLPITDDGIDSLSGLTQMRELYLAGTKVTNDVADTLAKFKSLTKLRIASTKFGTSGLEKIASLKSIVELDISDCVGIDNEALSSLSQLSQLAKLNLYSTSVGDPQDDDGTWELLAPLQSLTWLNVDKTAVGDESLEGIGQIASLTFLHLGSTQITDNGLHHLAGLGKLENLIVTRTAVTSEGVKELQTKLHDTTIQLEYVPQ